MAIAKLPAKSVLFARHLGNRLMVTRLMSLRIALTIAAFAALSGCQEEAATEITEQPVRALKTVLVESIEKTTTRRFPSVLQPGSVSTLLPRAACQKP